MNIVTFARVEFLNHRPMGHKGSPKWIAIKSSQAICTKFTCLVQDITTNISENTAINANFHFSYYKSMENLSLATKAIINIVFVEANAINSSTKFQVYRYVPYGFWRVDLSHDMTKQQSDCAPSEDRSAWAFTQSDQNLAQSDQVFAVRLMGS